MGVGETNGKIIAQVILFPKEKDKKATLAMMTFANDGTDAKFIPPVVPKNTSRFLGSTLGGKLVFFEQGQPPTQLVITQY